ncbi:hypothetical protein E2C01_059177 [Portunus trituberculatus]|uniref:Uncharacterized protein n=1 Tax=Portunus trituberculatus TaxID=210409 RepID=A0A5B7H4N2_PORTR|nr:hypothetical protein [Portunus trituberculatus]
MIERCFALTHHKVADLVLGGRRLNTGGNTHKHQPSQLLIGNAQREESRSEGKQTNTNRGILA